MRFGICTEVKNIRLLEQAGWDYIEPTVAGALQPEQAEAEIMPSLLDAVLSASTLRAETYNVFLPGDLKVVGPEVDEPRQNKYLDSAFPRAAALGGKVVVFGSGAARQIPEGFSSNDARRQVIDFLRRAATAAASCDITLAIEPLNKAECNHICSVAEATELAQTVAHPALAVLSDLYHITQDGQSYDQTRDAGALLRHVHLAGAKDRRAPAAADHDFLAGYFRVLKSMGYDGRISVEARWNDLPAEAGSCLETLHKAWNYV